MKQISLLKITLFIIMVFAGIEYSSGQNTQNSSADVYYSQLAKSYSSNQIPLNGKLSEYIAGYSTNHPYLLSSTYKKGSITLQGQSFSNVELMYDVYNQNVVVLYIDPQKTKYGILPPIDFVSEFTIEGKIFKRYCFGNACRIYEEVFLSDTIKCLYTWDKKRSESLENSAYVTYEYHSLKRKMYLVIDNKLIEFRGKGSFIKAFPKEHKKSISEFIKDHEIDIRRTDNDSMANLVKHCQQYIN